MSTYFLSFPKIVYDGRTITDITKRADFLDRIKKNASLFAYVILKDGDRPEDIAYEYYNDVDLYWIVLFLNEVVDPYKDWLLSSDRLTDHVKAKYGVENVNAIHHYELADGTWASIGTPFIVKTVSNYDYELSLNEKKRKIKLLKPAYLEQVITEYKKVMQS